jgi:hypothetical protein
MSSSKHRLIKLIGSFESETLPCVTQRPPPRISCPALEFDGGGRATGADKGGGEAQGQCRRRDAAVV